MNDLIGKITIPKSDLAHDFLNGEPANWKSAWVDLWTWANDRERGLIVGKGVKLQLKRGQLAHSQTTLARLWRWSQDKVKRFLVELQNEGLITFDTNSTTTIITVLDYPIYNEDTTKDVNETGNHLGSDQGNHLVNEMGNQTVNHLGTEVGSRKVEDRRGKRAREEFQEISSPSLEEFLAAARMQGVPDWRAESEYCWRDERPAERWPRPNWAKAVNSLVVKWRMEGAPMRFAGEKNGVKKTANSGSGNPGRTPAQARYEISRELEQVRERLEANYETGAPLAAEDVQAERELEGRLKTLEASN